MGGEVSGMGVLSGLSDLGLWRFLRLRRFGVQSFGALRSEALVVQDVGDWISD